MPGLRFYEVLELPLSASELDIRKAYRRLALKWHPDKNPQNKEVADRNFKAISEAYEVLSDKDKRKIYDRYGEQGLADNAATSQNGYGQYPGGVPADFVFPGFVFRSPFDVFRDFFGGHDPFQELFGDPFADMMNLHRNVEHIFSGGTAVSVAPNGALLAFPSLNLMSTGGFVHAGPMFAAAAFPGFGHQGMLPNGHLSLTMNGQSAAMGGGGGAGLRSVSSVTKFVNGRPVVEKRIVENGSETVELYDNGNLVSKTVDGVIYID